jgi:hypothetical protein
MIGLGTWLFNVKVVFYNGDVKVRIYDDNGQYGIEVLDIDTEIPPYKITSLKEDGNTIEVSGTTDMLPGRTVDAVFRINGDKCEGTVNVPFLGKVPLTGTKV